LRLAEALRIDAHTRLALVGAGGKTTALFQLARQLPQPVIVSATTHLALHQLNLADEQFVIDLPEDAYRLEAHLLKGVALFTGPLQTDGRTSGLDETSLKRLYEISEMRGLPLLLEADGSRQLPLKAPADHEPAIPEFVNHVVVVAGLSALGQPLSGEIVHRSELFGPLAGLQPGETIRPENLARGLLHPQGGLKSIPSSARRTALLNQVDDPALERQARQISETLLSEYSCVAAAHLASPDTDQQVLWVRKPVAGIILAAGGSNRYGKLKQVLPWRGEPLVRRAARLALEAGLSPVVVVTGYRTNEVVGSLESLAVKTVYNPRWEAGQSTSVAAGIRALPVETGAAAFILVDQPRMTTGLLTALVDLHARTAAPIAAPRVAGQRANPVLFDRVLFPPLLALEGDVGGRVFFSPGSSYQPAWLDWNDVGLLMDIDTPEDYQKLLVMEEQS
jgi:molybdenum cofactor cytidylyltransferase